MKLDSEGGQGEGMERQAEVDQYYRSPGEGVRQKRVVQGKSNLIKKSGSHVTKKLILGKLKAVSSSPPPHVQTEVKLASQRKSEPIPSASWSKEFEKQQQQSQQEMESLLRKRQTQFEQTMELERETLAKEVSSEKKRGYEDAFKQGYKEGREEGIQSLQERSEELTTAINDIFKEKNQLMYKSKKQILQLALDVSKEIVRSEISLQPNVTMSIVEEAIKRITDRDHVVIRLNPMEANWIRSHKDWLKDKMQDIGQLVIQEDDTMEVGGCIIETKLGYIDASLNTKITNIEATFLKVFEDEEGPLVLPNKEEDTVESDNQPSYENDTAVKETASAGKVSEEQDGASVPRKMEPSESIASFRPAQEELIEDDGDLMDPENLIDFEGANLMPNALNEDESMSPMPSSETPRIESDFSFDDDFEDDDFDFDDLDLD